MSKYKNATFKRHSVTTEHLILFLGNHDNKERTNASHGLGPAIWTKDGTMMNL